MTIAIRAEGLSKKYLIDHQRAGRHDTLRDELAALAARVGRRAAVSEIEEFWALDDVSFEIRQGERVGIIGRNGAGKSTLLKILSRITEPTRGRVSISGRVASLLEVGTGFHPELTGRENIFLNGAVLGMRRHEIQKKFDEIVAFAEVEKFLDTPVKRYSSGMYVRLAFAVAAHLEPEILIVDEVLAVGDAAFQRKCLDRMNRVGEAGTTVLFVSHNIAAIQNLCNGAILLNAGRLQAQGQVDSIVGRYLEQSQQLAEAALADRRDRSGNGAVRFTSFSLHNGSGENVGAFHSGQHARVRLHFDIKPGCQLKDVICAVGIDNEAGERMAYLSNEMTDPSFAEMPESAGIFEMEIDRLPFVAGLYRFTIFCSVNGETADWIQNAGHFSVETGDFYGTGRLPPARSQGHFLIDHRFHLHRGAR